MVIVLLALAIGAVFLGYKIGVDSGRREVLTNLNDRITRGLTDHTEFSSKFGIRGLYLLLDYITPTHQHGVGIDLPSPTSFVVVSYYDLKAKLRVKD